MLVCPVDQETLSKCEASELARVVDLLQRVDAETRIPNSSWTAHDAAAHLVGMVGRYLDAHRKRAATARDVDAINQDEIAEFETSTMGELVGRLRSRNAKYNAFWPELPLEAVFPLRGGLPLDVACLRTNWISELMMHGRDVALAVGEPWPLDETACLLSLRLLANVLTDYLRGIGSGVYKLVVAPDGGVPFSIAVKDNGVEIQPGPIDGVDRLIGPASALALLFYGRIGLAEAVDSGVRVDGDADSVQRLVDKMEKP